jgi:long-subunit fatty acid transport protein
MTKRRSASAALCLAVAGGASAASAGGLFVPGYGPQAQPRVGAFVAKADDPSALYYNPAGLARQKGTTLHLGMNFIDFEQKFQRAGVYETPEVGDPEAWTGDPYPEAVEDSTPAIGFAGFQGVPTLAVATDLGGRTPLVFGFGIIAEHGYPQRAYSRWGDDYAFEDPTQPPPPHRYDVVEQEVSAAFPSVAAAYSFGNLDVGARLSWGFANLRGTTWLWAVRNYEEDIHREAKFAVDVADHFIPAGQLGLLYRLSDRIELGAQYTTKRTVNGKGKGTAELGSGVGIGDMQDFIAPVTADDGVACADGGTVAALKSCVDFAMPQTATIGARYILRGADGRERGDLELDVQWEDWSSASDIKVVVDGKSGLTGIRLQEAFIRHGFQDTFSFRLGGGYDIPVGDNTLTARGGVAYDTAAAPLGWTRADLDGVERITFGAGLGYAFRNMRIDLGGGYVHEPERNVPDDCNPTLDASSCYDGVDSTSPPDDRLRPDPVWPLRAPNQQYMSPFNAGRYKQHYVLLSLGFTASF